MSRPSSPQPSSVSFCCEGTCFFIHNHGLVDPFPSSPRFHIPAQDDEGIRSVPLPGVRCPKCAEDGKEVWVIPGRACGYCGTACF